jgi:ammonia channel protein AmtB
MLLFVLQSQEERGSQGTGMVGHSIPLTALGCFLLFFGFLAFNGGSTVQNILKGEQSEKVFDHSITSGISTFF